MTSTPGSAATFRSQVENLPEPKVRFQTQSSGGKAFVVDFSGTERQSRVQSRSRSPKPGLSDDWGLEWVASFKLGIGRDTYLNRLKVLNELAIESQHQLDNIPMGDASQTEESAAEAWARRYRHASLAGAIMTAAGQQQQTHHHSTKHDLQTAKANLEHSDVQQRLKGLAEAARVFGDRFAINQEMLSLSTTVPIQHTIETAWSRDDAFEIDNEAALKYNERAKIAANCIEGSAVLEVDEDEEIDVHQWVSDLMKGMEFPPATSNELKDLIPPLEQAYETLTSHSLHATVPRFYAREGTQEEKVLARPLWYVTSGYGRLSRRHFDLAWMRDPPINDHEVQPVPSSWRTWSMDSKGSYLAPFVDAIANESKVMDNALEAKLTNGKHIQAKIEETGTLNSDLVTAATLLQDQSSGLAEHSQTMINWSADQISEMDSSFDRELELVEEHTSNLELNEDYMKAIQRLVEDEQYKRLRKTMEMVKLAHQLESTCLKMKMLDQETAAQMEDLRTYDLEDTEANVIKGEEESQANWEEVRRREDFDGPSSAESVSEILEQWRLRSEPAAHHVDIKTGTSEGKLRLDAVIQDDAPRTASTLLIKQNAEMSEAASVADATPSHSSGGFASEGDRKLWRQLDRAREFAEWKPPTVNTQKRPRSRRERGKRSHSAGSDNSTSSHIGDSDTEPVSESASPGGTSKARRRGNLIPQSGEDRSTRPTIQGRRSPNMTNKPRHEQHLTVPGQEDLPSWSEEDFPSLGRAPPRASDVSQVSIQVPSTTETLDKGIPAGKNDNDTHETSLDEDVASAVNRNMEAVSLNEPIDASDAAFAEEHSAPPSEATTATAVTKAQPRVEEPKGATIADATLDWVDWDKLALEAAQKRKRFSKLTDSWSELKRSALGNNDRIQDWL